MIPNNADYIFNQAVVYAYSSYFYFGGYHKGDHSIIARLDGSSYKWSQIGQLNEGKTGHNAIYINDHFLVVGGYGTKKTENVNKKIRMDT